MKLRSWILGVLYPRRCPICDEVLALDEGILCETCKDKLGILEGVHCLRCGKFMQQKEKEYCDDCGRRNHHFDEGFGVLPYSDWVKESMLRLKFHKRVEYTDFFSKLMAVRGKRYVLRWKPEVILPVPMYRKKKKWRGYDQAEILAVKVGEILQISVKKHLIRRIKNTKPQKELDPETRRKNLRTAFWVNPEIKQFATVLLIDDIYTTGSTVDAIAESIKKQGVKKVYVLTACTGIGT